MTSNKKKSVCKNFLRSSDIYAKPVLLTYKGHEQFKSTFGGAVSLTVVLFILSVFGYKLGNMFMRN